MPENTPAPDFMEAMMTGLDAIDENGAVPDVNSKPPVEDDPSAGTEDHGETDGADGGDAGTAESTDGTGGAGDGGNGAKDGTGGETGTAAEVSARKTAAAARERNPDGTFKQTPAEIAAAAKPALGPDGKPVAPKPEAKPTGDPINDPIPTNLKPATAERMGKLVTVAKELTVAKQAAEKDLDALIGTVSATGMNGEEFGQFLSVVGDARAEDDPVRQERAYQFFTNIVKDMATRLGKTAPGSDALEGHDDLQARVIAGQLLREDAEQLADARRQQAAAQQRQQATMQRQQAQTQQQTELAQARQTGRASMIELETTLAAADPQFAAKKAILAADAGFINTLRTMHPSQWVNAFNKKYRETKVMAPAAAPAARKVLASAPQPLRGRAPAGNGQVTTPKTIDEAMNAIDFSKV